MKPRVAIVGAGWAGLAAAVELAPSASVTVFEAGRAPGGRARRVRDGRQTLDNGQHILLGAYRETLRLMATVGADSGRLLRRLPLCWHQADGLSMTCPRLPAPLHLAAGLLLARGLGWRDKLTLALALAALSRARWQVGGDPTVADWLAAQRQPRLLIESFWQPMVLSALNTPLERASMRTLAIVLRDSLGGARRDSDLLLPQADLSALFPDPAWQWLAGHGVRLCAGSRVAAVREADGGVRVDDERFDAAVVACAPYHAAALLDHAPLSATVKHLEFWPIYTVYLAFDRAPCLPRAMIGLRRGCAHWLFDRHALTGETGLVAAVISAPPRDLPPADALIAQVADEVRRLAPHLSPPRWGRVLAERRATFGAVPGLQRPGVRVGVQSVYLAGDWVDGDYPATLEGAVRSGVTAARTLMRDMIQPGSDNT